MEKEWTVRAPKGRGLTAGELRAALHEVPGDVEPKVQISMGGKVKAITFKVNDGESR